MTWVPRFLVCGVVLTLGAELQGQSVATCTSTRATSSFAGVTFRLEERAEDGVFPVCLGSRTRVDANSDLVMSFAIPDVAQGDSISPEIRRLLALLQSIQGIGADIARIKPSEVNLEDSAAVKRLHEAINAVGRRVEGMLAMVDSVGLGAEFRGVIRRNRARASPKSAYAALAEWLGSMIETRESNLNAFLANRDRVRVQVAAYKDPLHGQRVQLHVQNYDELPEGKLQPIDRTGLMLSDAEREQLQISLNGNQQAAALLANVQQNAASIRNEVSATIGKISAKAEEFEAQVLSKAQEWAASLDTLKEHVEAVVRSETVPTAAAALRSIAERVTALRAEFPFMDSIATGLRGMRALVDGASTGARLDDVLIGLGDHTSSIVAMLRRAPDEIAGWVGQFQNIKALLDQLPDEIDEEARHLVLEGLQDAADWLKKQMPLTASLFEQAGLFFGQSKENGLDPADELKNLKLTTFRTLNDLPDATIELERAGWALRDRVTVVVRFYEQDSTPNDGPQPGRVADESSYGMEAALMGGHREFSTAVIFARASHGTGDQKSWKPNVAAMATWHHTFRHPGWFGSLFNSVDPALGFHLANLDQTDDNIEFGMGASATLFQGLVTGGYGYNLSRDTKGAYFFVGLDLYDLIQKAH